MKGAKRDRESGRAVKIDSDLLRKIKEFISRKENRLKYASIKQFFDIAALEKLEKESNINAYLLKKEETRELERRNIEEIKEVKREVKIPSGII